MPSLSLDEYQLISDWRTVSILRKEYFMPNDSRIFKAYAKKRGMSIDEYSVFLTGKHFHLKNPNKVTDDRIIEHLNKNCINGKIKYYPDQSDAWIKSFMSRNGYTTKEFLRLYGYIK